MPDYVPVFQLARELGCSPGDLIHVARSAGLNVTRAGALLHPGQVYRLRQLADEGKITRRYSQVQQTRRSGWAHHDADAWRNTRCPCCEYVFTHAAAEVKVRCDACADHYEVADEDAGRTIERLSEHLARASQRIGRMSTLLNQWEERRDQAYHSRNRWRGALVEIVLAHAPDERDPTRCVCGSAKYPCLTREHVEYVNRGIARQIEQLDQLSDEERDRVLYGRDVSYFDEGRADEDVS
jgi:hypothetical protein